MTFLWGICLLLLGVLLLLFGVFWLWFARQPRRSIHAGENIIVSPANGKIVKMMKFDGPVIAEKWNKGITQLETNDVAKRGWFVLIMMTPLDVHWQRAPLSGTIINTQHVPGKFKNAVFGASSLSALQNERNEILMKTKKGNIKVVQIAGLLARRISCFVNKDAQVNKGELIGFISFGSQVALLLPENAKLEVEEGFKVKDGERIGVMR
ncbi:phosphatidylserine decarboxylase family protein [Candidatus Woesearchaeota archaeon]|nr:phosphatidylserine decarboxylase family protein [Candidatus Woesearchaeota archaeon]